MALVSRSAAAAPQALPYRYRIECECGHVGYAPVGRPFIPRDQFLARCRCAWCGRKGAKSLIVEVDDTTPGWIKD